MHSDKYDGEHFRKTRASVGIWLTTMRPLWERWVKIIRKYRHSGLLLDAGCGEGYFLEHAEKYYDTYGIDVSNYGISEARQRTTRTKLSIASIEHINYKNESFDIITCFDVLEHLEYPEVAIHECWRVLKKGGIFVIRVPNTSSLGCKLKKEDWFGYKDNTHVSLLNNEEWFDVVQKNDFEILNAFYDCLWDTPYIKYIPKFLQDGLIKFPSAVFFLLGMNFSQRWGENLSLILKRA